MKKGPYPCRSCKASFVFRACARTGQYAPIEETPDPNGNIEIDSEGAGTYRVLSGLELESARAVGATLYMNHFVTCPAVADFKRRRLA